MPYLTLNNNRIYYDAYGHGAIPVILVHGLLLSSNMWLNYYVPQLSREYKVFILDMRGHGNSIPAENCTIQNMADDVFEFIKVINLKRVVFIGASMGGGIGLQLALKHSDVFLSLILLSPVTGLGDSGLFLFRLLGSMIAQRRWLLRIILKSVCTAVPPKDLLESALNDAMKVKPSVLKEFISDKPPIANIQNLNRMDIPTLVIGGTKDSAVPIKQQIQLAEKIPAAEKIIFRDSGHMVTYEKREEIIQKILLFLNSALNR